ncbi:MAG: acylphosphatase, partial [Bacteroidota bacterium]
MKVYHPQKSINHLIIKTLRITVTGLIQGVGFRPFVYRTALKHGLTGWVQNTNENVRILVTGSPGSIADFLFSLEAEAPPAAMIENIHTEEAGLENFSAFVILKSSDVSDDITEISPDIAVCTDCLNDMEQAGNRPDYPFVNCTNCGPRFTIIRELPYDRSKTTMQTFPMCQRCRNEYENVTDRRFHAQPIACSDCGPQYELFSGQRRVSTDIS